MSKIILIVNSTIKHPCSVSFPILPARVVHVWHTSFTPRFYGENFPRVICLPKLPRASQLFVHFLTKRDEPFTWKTKRWFGHLNAMVGSSSQPGERFSVWTLWFAQPCQLGQSEVIRACVSAVLENQSMRRRSCLGWEGDPIPVADQKDLGPWERD